MQNTTKKLVHSRIRKH